MIRQEIWWWLLRIFYLFFFLFIINRIFFVSSGMVEQAASCIMYPFVKVHGNIASSLKGQSDRKKTVQQLTSEIDQLTIEQAILKAQVAGYQAQQILIDQSKELVEFAMRYDQSQSMSMAKVLLSYSCPQEDTIFIEGGSNKKYAKDDIVIYQNALVGRIIEVYPWYSKVALITDQRCRVSSITGTLSEGISCGKNNNQLDLCFVPHFKPVELGALVVSTGHGLLYPAGFTIGIVKSITTDLVSHTIELKPYYNLHEISYVYVLLKNEPLTVQVDEQLAPE